MTIIPKSLQNRIGFIMSKAAQHITQMVDDQLSDYHIKAKHYGILSLLDDQGPMTQIDIGNTLQIDRTSMVGFIDDLEQLELVERRRNPNDRRAYNIHLTSTGQKSLADLHTLVQNTEAESLSALSSSETSHLLQLLLKITQ
jgi:DNA-binding MarR family transcriptional regulator